MADKFLVFRQNMRVGVIVNPNAGKLRRREFERSLNEIAQVAQRNRMLRVVETQTPEDVPNALEQLLDWGVEVLALFGGDGTLHLVLTRLIELVGEAGPFPYLLPLHGGTINVVAENLGITGTPDEVLFKFLLGLTSASLAPAMREINVLKIRDETDKRTLYGFVFASGFLYNAMNYYYGLGGGYNAAVKTAWTFITGLFIRTPETERLLEPMRANIRLDGRNWKFDRVNVFVASAVPNLVLFFSPFAKKDPQGGFFTVLNSMPQREVFIRALPLSLGLVSNIEGHYNEPCHTVELEFDGGFTIDGELFDAAHYEIRIDAGPIVPMVAWGG